MAYDDHVEQAFKDGLRNTTTAGRIDVSIKRVRIALDPRIDVFNIEIAGRCGVWKHTAGSEEALNQFLEGVRASATMQGGHIEIPPVPAEPAMTVMDDHMLN